MRTIILGAVLVAAGALTASASPTTGIGRGNGLERQSGVELVQYEGRYCRRLRRACENKDVRGEVGEGNCRRYRRECGRR